MTTARPIKAREPVYPAFLEHLAGEVIVRFPDFPEALTGAATETEALSMAADALEEAVLARLENGEEVPLPPNVLPTEHVGVMLAPLTAARVREEHAARDGG